MNLHTSEQPQLVSGQGALLSTADAIGELTEKRKRTLGKGLQFLENAHVNSRRPTTPERPDYASASAVRVLLRQSAPLRGERLRAADMVSLKEAALLVGERSSTVRRWVAAARCIGIPGRGRSLRLPRWQFEEDLLLWIGPIAEELCTASGWTILSFLETPSEALSGRTPRQAIEQGDTELVMALASSA